MTQERRRSAGAAYTRGRARLDVVQRRRVHAAFHASRTRTARSGRLLIKPSTPHASRRRMSASSSTVQTCTFSPCSCAWRTNRGDTILREAAPALAPGTRRTARAARGHRRHASIHGQPHFGVGRARRHVRQRGTRRGGAARAIARRAHALGCAGPAHVAGNRLAHLTRIHLHLDDRLARPDTGAGRRASAGTPTPWPRKGNVPPAANRQPASTCAQVSAAARASGPDARVVRSSVAS